MITLHCQHRDERGKKCGCAAASIINGVLVLSFVHNGEKHITPLTLDDLKRLIEQDKQRRDEPLRKL